LLFLSLGFRLQPLSPYGAAVIYFPAAALYSCHNHAESGIAMPCTVAVVAGV